MDRRNFLMRSVTGGVATGIAMQPSLEAQSAPRSDLPSRFTPSMYAFPRSPYNPFGATDYYSFADDLVIERNRPGKPHRGKVLAAVVILTKKSHDAPSLNSLISLRAETGRYRAFSMISRTSSMPVWEAASISMTSTWRDSMIAWQCTPSSGMSMLGLSIFPGRE